MEPFMRRGFASFIASSVVGLAVSQSLARQPVVVELFTSEGCSSCPSADDVLTKLQTEQPVAGAQVIALSYHVDYWNRLGWADPFSSPVFTQLQNEYANAFSARSVYTPQMIVNGRVEFVGSRGQAAVQAITQAADDAAANSEQKPLKLTVVFQQRPEQTGRIKVNVDASAVDASSLWVAVTESDLNIVVGRGENGGRTLAHSGVVRKLIQLKPDDKGQLSIDFDPAWKHDSVRVVAFARAKDSPRIIAAAEQQLVGCGVVE
jgi:hypothetical protein